MWLNEHRRRRGWKRFLPTGRQRRFLLVLLPKRCGHDTPHAGRLSPGRCLSWGLLRAPARSARRHGGSGTLVLGFGSPASPLARRASAAAVAGPQEPPPRTVPLARAGGGGRERRGFEVCGAPAGSPCHGVTLVAPGLPEGGFPAATRVAGAGPRRR